MGRKPERIIPFFDCQESERMIEYRQNTDQTAGGEENVRKLMIAALSLSGAVFLSYYLLPLRWILPCASVCAAAAFSCFLLRKGERWIYMAFLCLIGAATGFSAYALHWNRTLRYAEQWDGTEQIISVQVMEAPTQLDHSLRLHVRRTEAPKLDMMLYDYNGLIQNLKPGNTLTVSARLRRADLRYGERSDSLVSKDIYLTGTLTKIEARHADHHSLRTVAALCWATRRIFTRILRFMPGCRARASCMLWRYQACISRF